jgi:hypothetical protein
MNACGILSFGIRIQHCWESRSGAVSAPHLYINCNLGSGFIWDCDRFRKGKNTYNKRLKLLASRKKLNFLKRRMFS